MPNNTVRYSIDQLRNLGTNKLVSIGLSEEEASCLIDSMLGADMDGVATHGIRMLPGYVERIESGQFRIEEIQIIKQTPAFTTIDANSTVGAISAVKAVNIAIENAKKYGLHMVFVRNCNTYGAASYYVELMAKEGLVGFTCSNSPAAMPASNGLQQMMGTNPFAFACPTASYGNIVIDMATSIVAKSKFQTAKINNEQLQPGWALDAEGNPTTDPVEAIKGFILPMAGHKGYGIAMMIDIMSGVLSGAAYLNKVGKFYSKDNAGMDVGQMFVAINPEEIYDGDFYKEMDVYEETLRGSKTYPGKDIVIPGDGRREKRKLSEEKGILLTDDTVAKLTELFGTELQQQSVE